MYPSPHVFPAAIGPHGQRVAGNHAARGHRAPPGFRVIYLAWYYFFSGYDLGHATWRTWLARGADDGRLGVNVFNTRPIIGTACMRCLMEAEDDGFHGDQCNQGAPHLLPCLIGSIWTWVSRGLEAARSKKGAPGSQCDPCYPGPRMQGRFSAGIHPLIPWAPAQLAGK